MKDKVLAITFKAFLILLGLLVTFFLAEGMTGCRI